MGLRRKPHTFTVQNLTIPPVTATRKGQITPEQPRAAFDKFGVELSAPYLLLDDPDGLSYYVQGGTVTWKGREFSVAAPPKDWSAGRSTDCVEVLLEERR